MDLNFCNIFINLSIGSVLPILICSLCHFDIISLITAKILILVFIIIFVVLPLIFKFTYKFQSALLFLNFVHVPYNADYAHPEKYGLPKSRNFYLRTDDGVTLGVWQILPDSLNYQIINETADDQYYENLLGNGQDVIIYMHGNAGTRLSEHRVELYKILRKYFHVIAFDYRSYGDSTKDEPSEDKLISDCIFMYNWVANKTKGNLFVWGHSLGTSLVLHSLSILQKNEIEPKGVILEAPFNNMREEISEFPLAKMFKYLPWFHYTVIEPMQENGFTFESDRFICEVDAPILILHAEDDHVVPIKLGKKLYKEGMRCRRKSQGQLIFQQFEGKYKYEHKYICRSPKIDKILSDFITVSKSKSEKKLINR